MTRILLVQPKRPNNIWRVLSLPKVTGKTDLLPPLSLATIAALTPKDNGITVDLHEENLQGEIDDTFPFHEYDIIGITAITPVFPQVRKLADIFHRHGKLVVIGRAGITSYPEYYRDVADVMFIGEAEKTWPQFVLDWQNGNHKKRYQQFEKISMDLVPIPQWELIGKEKLQNYFLGAVQFSRGCNFKCDFCEVVHRLGQGMRYKSIEQGMKEIKILQGFGFDNIFMCDDNLAGNPQYLKEFLREIIKFNRTLKLPLSFSTQISLNIAKDDELLELLADANFKSMLVGIESPDPDALRSVNKSYNLKTDIVKDIEKIHSYGMPVTPSMIVGLDTDTVKTFTSMRKFISTEQILVNCANMFTAPPGTELFYRLAREKRVVVTKETSSTIMNPNIIPKNMTRRELFESFIDFHTSLWADLDNYLMRVKRYYGSIRRKPRVKMKTWRLLQKYHTVILRLTAYYLFSWNRSKLSYLHGLMKLTHYRLNSMMDTYWFYFVGPFQDEVRDWVFPYLKNKIREEAENPPDLINLDDYFTIVDRFPFDELRDLIQESYILLYKRFRDIQKTNDTIFEVLQEFIESQKDSFPRPEHMHTGHILRLCAENSQIPEEYPSSVITDEEVLNLIRKHKLDRELYDAVCKELRMKYTKYSPQPPSRHFRSHAAPAVLVSSAR